MSEQGPAQNRTEWLRDQVGEMRVAHVTYQRIADELGISKSYVIKLWNQIRDSWAEELDQTTLDRHLALEVARYDRLVRANWAQRTSPSHATVIIRAMEAKEKLLGLRAPVRVEHGGVITTSEESQDERAQRLMRDAVEEIGQMSPEQLAAEIASLG